MNLIKDCSFLKESLCSNEIARLVIITKNGKRLLKDIIYRPHFEPPKYILSCEPSVLIWTDDQEWETEYKMSFEKFCELLDKNHIKACYYKN